MQLAAPELIAHTKKLEADFETELDQKDLFKLITKRAVTTHNSWTHNIDRMTSHGRHTNYAYLHPQDMRALGIEEMDLVDISSDTSSIRIRVKPLDTLMQKTVAVPHGWGHQHAKGLTHANKTEGVNVNILAADGTEKIDRISGMAHLTGFIVDIKPTKEALQPTWSGQ